MTKKQDKETKQESSAKKVINDKAYLEELLEAGCHFGHSVSKVNPRMQDYIYTARKGVHIFDLTQTKAGIERAADFLAETITGGGEVIFVGTKRQATEAVKKTAEELEMHYVIKRWVGGLLTNWKQIQKNLQKLADLRERVVEEKDQRTKYELSVWQREIGRLESLYGGIEDLEEPPAAIFVVDVKRERTAVREANRRDIPVVGIVDTNADPSGIDYIIPANDDAQGSITYIMSAIKQRVLEEQD